MPELTVLYDCMAALNPFGFFDGIFLYRALLAMLLLAPTSAMLGVQVVNHRMAFFSDAVSHSALAGLALGVLLSIGALSGMMLLAVLMGAGIVLFQRRSGLSADSLTGVFFSATVALGLAMLSSRPELASELQMFLYGNILTLGDRDIWLLFALLTGTLIFMFFWGNTLFLFGLNPALSEAHSIRSKWHMLAFSILLSVTVVIALQVVGVLLVTALLVVPAATARNLAKSAAKMYAWSVLLSLLSSVIGLIVSALPEMRSATGTCIILTSCGFFFLSLIPLLIRKNSTV